LSNSSIASGSSTAKPLNKQPNRRSKKYKYNLATQTAVRLSTATTVTSSHQASVSTNLRKNNRSSNQKGSGRKSISMYASTNNEETCSTPMTIEHRQKWMRNVLERLLVTTNENHAQNYQPHHHSSLPSPLGAATIAEAATISSSLSSSPVDIVQNNFAQTELSPLSTVVNEARLSLKQLSTSYDSPLIVKERTKQFVDAIDFEVLKNRFYSDIAQKIKEISNRYFKMINQNPNISTSTLFDLTPQSYFQSESSEIQCEHDSFSSIPFIDEDSTSLISFHEQTKTPETPETLDSCSSLHDLIQNLSCENFDTMLAKLLVKNQCGNLTWFKIAFVFEFVNKATQFVQNIESLNNNKDELILRLKEMGANYIHTKYCDWIYEQGGWISLVRDF
jgi:hypothetical protein